MLTLFTCPRLVGTPRITEVTCAVNRERAHKAPRPPVECTRTGAGAKRVSREAAAFLAGVSPCVSCPGVRELQARGEAPPPTEIDTAGIASRLRTSGHGSGAKQRKGWRIGKAVGSAKAARMALGDEGPAWEDLEAQGLAYGAADGSQATL